MNLCRQLVVPDHDVVVVGSALRCRDIVTEALGKNLHLFVGPGPILHTPSCSPGKSRDVPCRVQDSHKDVAEAGQQAVSILCRGDSVTRYEKTLTGVPVRVFVCAPEGIRTPNLLIRSQMLYPLSYGRMCIQLSLVTLHQLAEARGFEPPVPGKGDNSLAVSPIRPLWHASSGIRCSRTAGSKHYTCPQGKRKTPGQRRVDVRSPPSCRPAVTRRGA